MIDYSFLRFKNTIEEAISIEPKISSIHYYGQVHLIPNEFYAQITNFDDGIEFAGDYEAYLVDLCGNEIEEITSKVRLYEFSDIRGINQIRFEFYLTEDYGLEPMLLKLKHTQSYEEFFSSPFVCSELLKEQTSLFTYRSYGYFKGISYDKVEQFQNIRLNLYLDYPENKTEVGEYYQVTRGRTISDRALYGESEKYSCEAMNAFYFSRINIMLIHDVVYVDGVRITNKPQLANEERLMDSNIFTASFDCFKDYDDAYAFEADYYRFDIVYLYPQGIFTSQPPVFAEIRFSDNVIDNGNTIIRLRDYSNGDIIQTVTSSGLTIVGNKITFSLPLGITFGKYYFEVSGGSLSSPSGKIFDGINNKETWNYWIKEGDYKLGDYDSDDYSIIT